ncbi:hypothetical protein BJV74DRAFT_887849 [Russula compacta]|nr:hypothetical protein BJV74DRAFT_887849 [Russula compacta]
MTALVAAECEAKKQAMEEKICEGERAKEFLVLMNINEDLNNEELLTENLQCLSAVICKHGRACLDDSDGEGEVFDFDAVEDGVYLDDPTVGPAKMKGKTVRKPKKAAKGELRGNIKAKEMRLRGKEDDSGREAINKAVNVCFTAFDSAPKNYQNAGLREDLKSKRAPEIIDPFQSGGLDDEDIISDWPSFPCPHNVAVPAIGTNMKQGTNPLVGRFCNLQGRDGVEPSPQAGYKNKLVEVVAKSDSGSIPVTVKATKLQHMTRKEDPKADMDLGVDHPTAAKFLHDPHWANVFIPTITHALYISQEPCLNFASESPMFLTTVQKIFNLSFPNVDLVLASDDPLVVTSKLASGILEAITKFFNCDMFINQPEKIRDHIHWAIKGDGPAYYKTPTPKNSNIARDDPCYQAPDSFLQSQFIAPSAEQHLKYAKNSILYPLLDAKHPPKGLYALLLTAQVERAFTMFLSGMYIEPPLFAHKHYWRAIRVFLGHVERINATEGRRNHRVWYISKEHPANPTDRDIQIIITARGKAPTNPKLVCIHDNKWKEVHWTEGRYTLGAAVPQLHEYDTEGSEADELLNKELEGPKVVSDTESDKAVKEIDDTFNKIKITPVEEKAPTFPIRTLTPLQGLPTDALPAGARIPSLSQAMSTQTTTATAVAAQPSTTTQSVTAKGLTATEDTLCR